MMINKQKKRYVNGESTDLLPILINGRQQNLQQRTAAFYKFIKENEAKHQMQYRRKIISKMDTTVLVEDRYTQKVNKLLMFGSNNYLGFAAHLSVKKKIIEAVHKYGVGLAGPPLLNGYTKLHQALEDALSTLKGTEDTLLFTSGYNANVGLATCLFDPRKDIVHYDIGSHASFYDGLKMSKVQHYSFQHNDCKDLYNNLLTKPCNTATATQYISAEGVYSMDGDVAPLDKIVKIAKEKQAVIILDDAHGTLVKGKNGGGTAEAFGLKDDIDITVGTFSKAFAVNGGFISASKEIINYLRFFARSYMFSASLPIPTVAAALACLEINEKEPHLRAQLDENAKFVVDKIKQYGLVTMPQSAIIALRVPKEMNIKKIAFEFQELGVFVNTVEYPAVPKSEQRIRISLMATHTKKQLNRLIDVIDEVWNASTR